MISRRPICLKASTRPNGGVVCSLKKPDLFGNLLGGNGMPKGDLLDMGLRASRSGGDSCLGSHKEFPRRKLDWWS